ncbi:hypothetical protein CEQ90_06560 [Lewinellaceae bacterium SD302]|nr:hypothetical protein CEQ90_06560 [Lewinellaceae bacterium SD302]
MQEQIISFIKTDIHAGRSDLQIEADEDLLSSGLLGSMDMVRVIEFIERTFEIKVAPQEMTIDNFITVEAMESLVNAKK